MYVSCQFVLSLWQVLEAGSEEQEKHANLAAARR